MENIKMVDIELSHSDRLSKYFSYLPLSTIKAEETQDNLVCPELADPTCYIGIEIEVEKLRNWNIESCFGAIPGLNLWRHVEDGSLKNKGREFVSQPIRGKNILLALESINAFLQLKNPNHEFSIRCGTHIHVNVRYMTLDQLVRFLFLYIAVENLLYHQAGEDRINSNFCVPVNQSKFGLSLPEFYILYNKKQYKQALHLITSEWKKYTGLNLLPIPNLGTVEFRHYQGTSNIQFLLQQINFIQSLRLFAIKNSMKSIEKIFNDLNTNSSYATFVQNVFGTDFNIPYSSLKSMMENNITSLKQIMSLQKNSALSSEFYSNSPLLKYLKVNISSLKEIENRKMIFETFKNHTLDMGVDNQFNHYIMRHVLNKVPNMAALRKAIDRKKSPFIFK